MSELPKGWAQVTLSDVATWSSGGTPSRSNPEFYNGSIPWLKTGELGPRMLFSSEEHISEAAIAGSSAKLFPKGSVALAMYGATIGKASILGIDATTNQACAVGIPKAVTTEFLYYYLISQTQGFVDAGKGGAQPNISQGIVREWPICLAPLQEQNRIVAKLEELLSDLDAGVAELKAAQAKLGQYRQSLLKAAVDGSLTAEWRKTHKSKESGAQLLERILAERRKRWEAKQLAKFQEQGKTPPKGWQNHYPNPVRPDTASLPELPEGWVWATLSQVGWLDRGRSKYRPRNAPHLYGGPYSFVQTGDIRHADTFLFDVEATYSEAGLAQSRLWPAGTMCITIAANIGKTAILSMKACFPDSVVGFLPTSEEVSVRYVEYFMRSVQQRLEDDAPATAQKNINLEILEKVVIPVPPIKEQLQILKVLSDSMDSARETDSTIDISLKQATAQRKNILKAAFSGQLAPQDPNDEPASVLLERIRAERAAQGAKGVKRGRKAKA